MLKITKEGLFDNTYNNDALILQHLTKYKAIKVNNEFRTGYPTTSRAAILSLLREKEVSYVVYNKNVIEDKYNAPNNKYNYYLQIVNKPTTPTRTLAEVINAIKNCIDPYTGENIYGLDTKTINQLEEMFKNLTQTTKTEPKENVKPVEPSPQTTNPKTVWWTYDEQKLLLELYKNDVPIIEIANRLHKLVPDIETMLIKLGAKQKRTTLPTAQKPKTISKIVVEVGDTVVYINLETNEEFTKTIIQGEVTYKPVWGYDHDKHRPKYVEVRIPRADPNKNEIDDAIPLAKAMLDKKINDIFYFKMPDKKTIKCKIVKVIKNKNN